jgi:hypothetical protein
VLPYALAHNSRLAVMHGESFFEQNSRYMDGEPLCAFLKFLTASKCEVVGVSRVCCSGGLR